MHKNYCVFNTNTCNFLDEPEKSEKKMISIKNLKNYKLQNICEDKNIGFVSRALHTPSSWLILAPILRRTSTAADLPISEAL